MVYPNPIIKLPKTLHSNKKIMLSKDNYKVDFRVLDINNSDLEYDENQISNPNNIKELLNIDQTVIYKNIQNNVDLEYA